MRTLAGLLLLLLAAAPRAANRPATAIVSKDSFFALLALVSTSESGSTVSLPYPLQNQVKDSDAIVVGTIARVIHDRCSLVFHRYMREGELAECGEAEHAYTFDAGELSVEEVLKGSVNVEHTQVMWCSGYRMTPTHRKCLGMPCGFTPTPAEGQNGIWLLRRDRVFGTGFHQAYFASVDSLEAVKAYIKRDRYIDTTKR